MTLGQHIQALRKEAGYSQEALGEALGVTRQSISKWESDQAIPEVDKLVTLSRLFQVPVGVLLQVEQPVEPQDAKEHLEEVPQQPKRVTWPMLLVPVWTAALVWLILLLVGLSSRVNSLDESLSEVRMEMAALQAEVNEAKARASAELSAFVVLESVDYPAGEAVFSLTAAPETVREGMKVFFSAASDEFPWEYIQARGQLNASGQYTAKLTCPLANDITFSAIFDSGEAKEVHILTTWSDLLDESCAQVNCQPGLTEDAIQNGVLRWNGPVKITLHPGSADLPEGKVLVETVSLELRVYWNGQSVWGPVAVDLSQVSEEGALQVPVSLELELKEGDTLRLVAYQRDSLGRDWLERTEYLVREEQGELFLAAWDVIFPYRVPLRGEWASLDSDASLWKTN